MCKPAKPADAARARRKRTEELEEDDAETEAGAFGPGLGKSGGGVEGDRSRIAMDAGRARPSDFCVRCWKREVLRPGAFPCA